VLRIVVWFLLLLVVELAIALFMLGTWLIEGRRRAEEIDRLTELWRAAPRDAGVDVADHAGMTDRQEAAPLDA
jgi:hypothetical protein